MECPFNFFYKCLKNTFLLQGCEDGMTLIADNPFINKKELCPFEKGIRIDYILFKVGKALRLCFCISIRSCSQQDSEFVMWPFFLFPGFPQSGHSLWFHVHHQRLRPRPSIPVLRPRGSDCWTQAGDTHSSWRHKWPSIKDSGLCCRYAVFTSHASRVVLTVSRSLWSWMKYLNSYGWIAWTFAQLRFWVKCQQLDGLPWYFVQSCF